jgi:cytidylate kinase
MPMIKDPIVDEVRRLRQEHAKEHDNDLDRIVESLRKRERDSKRKLLNPGPAPILKKTGS